MHPKVGFYLPGIDSTPKKSPVGVSGEHAFLQKHPPCFSPSSVIFVELSHSTHTEPLPLKALQTEKIVVEFPPPSPDLHPAEPLRRHFKAEKAKHSWRASLLFGALSKLVARLLLAVKQKAGKEKMFIQMVKLMLSLVTSTLSDNDKTKSRQIFLMADALLCDLTF